MGLIFFKVGIYTRLLSVPDYPLTLSDVGLLNTFIGDDLERPLVTVVNRDVGFLLKVVWTYLLHTLSLRVVEGEDVPETDLENRAYEQFRSLFLASGLLGSSFSYSLQI